MGIIATTRTRCIAAACLGKAAVQHDGRACRQAGEQRADVLQGLHASITTRDG
jgi:hypothetical protein